MNRNLKMLVNWCCCPVVAPLVLLVYAVQGRLATGRGRAQYIDGLKQYLNGEI